jgi:hypothetical protein
MKVLEELVYTWVFDRSNDKGNNCLTMLKEAAFVPGQPGAQAGKNLVSIFPSHQVVIKLRKL